jgi:hypothetical protein
MTGYSVAIPTQLRSYTAGAANVRVVVAPAIPHLAEVLEALDAAYPGIPVSAWWTGPVHAYISAERKSPTQSRGGAAAECQRS